MTDDTNNGPEQIGRVVSLDGEVRVERADGASVLLDQGAALFRGDRVQTSSDAGIGVVLDDQTLIAMAENGRMTFEQFEFDPGSLEGSVRISATRGVFTVVGGDIARGDPEAMTIETPVATINVGKSQLGFDIADTDKLIAVMMATADGQVGEVTLRTADDTVVLDHADHGATVTAAEINTYTVPLEELLRMFGSVLGFLPDMGQANDYGVDEATLEDLIAAAIAEQSADPGEDISESDQSEESEDQELADLEAAAGGQDTEEPLETIGVVGSDYTGPGDRIEPVVPPPPAAPYIPKPPAAPDTGRRNEIPVQQQDINLVLDLNAQPVAFDEYAPTDEDKMVRGRLTATDSDNDELTFSVLTPPDHGRVVLNESNGQFTYEPDENYSGPDSFTYQVDDGNNGFDEATVTIDVAPVADKPSLDVVNTTAGTDALPGKDTLTGTEDADTLIGGGNGDTLSGLGGDDVLYGDSAGPETAELDIKAALTDIDTSEVLSVTVEGVPADATLSAGELIGDVWHLGPDDLDGLTLNLAEGFTDNVRLTVEAAATEQASGDIATTSANLRVDYTGAIPGRDQLFGGEGDDTLSGGGGTDQLSGGEGNDTFVFQTYSGKDTISDYNYGETIRFDGDEFSGSDMSVSMKGPDTIITFGAHDKLEVILDNVDSNSMSYTITSDPDDSFVNVVLEET